jgi:hypothetical protein
MGMAPRGNSGSYGQSDGSGGYPPAPKAIAHAQQSATAGTQQTPDGPYQVGHTPPPQTTSKYVQGLTQDNQSRPAPNLGNTNYAGQGSEQLSTAIKAANSKQISSIADSWNNLGNSLVKITSTLQNAANTAGSGWQGQAADAALQFHTQVANWTNNTAAGTQVTGANVADQAAAVSDAQNSMPTPYTYTMAQAQQAVMTAPDPLTAVTQAQANLNKAAENHNQSVQVASTFHQNLATASQKMPAIAPTPSFSNNNPGSTGTGNGSSGAGGAGGSGGAAGGGSFSPHLSAAGSAGGGGSSGGGIAGGGGLTAPPQPNTSGSGSPGSGLNTAGFTGPPGTTLTNNPTGNGPTGPNGGQGGGLGGMPIGGMPMGGGFGSGGDSTYSPSGGGYGGGGAGYGRSSGFGPAGGSAGESGSSGGVGSGARSAAGAAAAEDSAIGSGSAGARGASGTSAGGMGGGGRGGKGQGDSEHKRASYLVEADPDSIFGTDEKTAPPVIGG